jgi:hypothetical protein
MISETNQNNLVAGRAGELTLEANDLTFNLLEHIFGQHGPFRETLKDFGVKVNETSESYLVLLDGKVYTDIKKEERILWGNYPIKLEKVNHEVKAVVTFTLNPFKYYNYVQKSLLDSKLILNSVKTIETCMVKYKYVSEQTVKATESQHLSMESFLSLYKEIAYVSYAYELVEIYNGAKAINARRGNVPSWKPAEHDYLYKNDYLLADTSRYIENVLKLPKGFYLDNYPNLRQIFESAQGLDFIPGRIPTIPNTEIMLQCLKNNLRLKTNVLLFILNMSL